MSRGQRDRGAFDLVIRRAGAAGVTRRRLVAGVVDEDEELSWQELSFSLDCSWAVYHAGALQGEEEEAFQLCWLPQQLFRG